METFPYLKDALLMALLAAVAASLAILIMAGVTGCGAADAIEGEVVDAEIRKTWPSELEHNGPVSIACARSEDAHARYMGQRFVCVAAQSDRMYGIFARCDWSNDVPCEWHRAVTVALPDDRKKG